MLHLLKSIIGGMVSGGISVLGQTQYYLLSGILPFFPTFALVASMTAQQTGDVSHVKSMALFMTFAVIPIIGFNVALFLLVDKYSFLTSIGMALMVWFALAYALYIIWPKVVG